MNQPKERIALQVFMTSEVSNYSAAGIFDGEGILVIKGSIVNPIIKSQKLDAEERNKLLTADMQLLEDTYFQTPDAAAQFVSGRNSLGWIDWKTATGESLNKYRGAQAAKQLATPQPTKIIQPQNNDTHINASQWEKHELRTRKRLLKRLSREFEKKFFIGDIVISDQEYLLLLKNTKSELEAMVKRGSAVSSSISLAVTLVQIGIRKYDGKHFWPYVEQELETERHFKHQQLLGDAFINTLRSYGKYITDATERVQNILFHGFVSNYYSKGLFELLFQYYANDLERDIYRNTTEQMQALMDTLAQKATQDEAQSESFTDQFMAKGSRAYKLRNHTLQAISAHPIHSRTRLRRLLRLIDRAFWKNSVPQNPTSRLTILFKEWINDSPAYKKEYKLYQLGEIRNKGKKHFSTPYLFAHIGSGRFDLKLPAQIIPEEYAENLVWEITTCTRTFCLDADTYPVLTGFKTEDAKADITPKELFGDIHCQLVCNGQTIRKFPHLPATTTRFFDMEGDYAPRLFKIPMCAYTTGDHTLQSSALISKVPHNGMIRWDFEFQQGDLVVLPDGTGLVVGDLYTNGLVPRGKISGVEYRSESDTILPVYASAPELLLTIPKEKISGTVLYVNDIRYRLSDCQFADFENKDARGMQAFLLSLSQFETCKTDGVKNIILDVPGSTYDKQYSFLLANGLSVEFPGAPYIFEERGAVRFPSHIRVSGTYEKLQGENGYQFTLNATEPELNVFINDHTQIWIQIPMLTWSQDQTNWNLLPAGELWHTEFFDIRKLYLKSPSNKISITTDIDVPDDEDSESRTIHAESGADGIYTIDMTRFRSWLTRDIMKNDILLKVGKEEYTFATVYTKSLVSSYDVSANYDESTLTWLSDIIGKADYYLDIVHTESGTVIGEKLPLRDGKVTIQDKLRSGLYQFTLYEAEEDDSGFDDLVYEQLLHVERHLVNQNDASGQFLKIMSFRLAHTSNLYTYFKREYYVTDFQKIEKNIYRGHLLADGEKTGLNVEVCFLKKDDMRIFHLTAWHEEEEIYVDLLYDRNRGTLELDQLPGLRSSESYRRYKELTYGDYVYFGILHDKLPDFKPHTQSPVGKQKPKYSGKQAMHIDQLGLSVRSYNALHRAGILYAGDIFNYPTEQWLKVRNLGRNTMEDIVRAMDKLGLPIANPHAERNIPNLSISLPTSRPLPEVGIESKQAPLQTGAASTAALERQPQPSPNRNILLQDLDLPQKIYFELLMYGIETAGDIADLTPFAWSRMKQLTPSDMNAIHEKMKELGLRIKK